MSVKFLKIKIKSLAEEAKIIRHEENKTKGQYRWLGSKQGRETELERTLGEFWSMREHRTTHVRDESRSALVAYGFIRGKPYRVVENATVDNPPNWNRVVDLTTKYGPVKDRPSTIKTLKSWVAYDKNGVGKKILEEIK